MKPALLDGPVCVYEIAYFEKRQPPKRIAFDGNSPRKTFWADSTDFCPLLHEIHEDIGSSRIVRAQVLPDLLLKISQEYGSPQNLSKIVR